MKKALTMLLVIAMVMGLFAGCGSSTEASEAQPAAAEPATTEEAAEPEETVKEATDSLVIYSPHKADMINPIIKEFQETTGIKVEVVAAGTGELLKRIESEKDNPLGDIMWGGGAESLNAFAPYFEPYASPNAKDFDSRFVGKDNVWTGTSPLPMVIMYNKNLVKPEDVPAAWEDLLDPKWKGRIAYADPTRSGSSFTILATMLEAHKDMGDDGWVFINEFFKNLDGKLTSGSSGVYKGVADGEYAVGLTLEKTAMEYVAAGADVGVVYPADGTSAAPDGIAIIKGAKNEVNAQKFFDFALTAKTQKFVYDNFFSRPVSDGVQLSEEMPAMSDIVLVDYDLEWVSANKEDIVKKWKDVVIGKYE